MELKGKKALVTGAAKRVGKAIALALAKKGCGILLHYNRSEREAHKTAHEIEALGVLCEVVGADLSDAHQTFSLAHKINENVGHIDFLINSASVFYKTPIGEATEKDFDTFMDANLKGPFLLSKEIGGYMMKSGGGKIINIADWSGIRPYKDYAPYCASKGGLITLTKSLARDLAPKVYCNAVAPGPVMLPEDFSEEEAQAIAKLTALGRIGKPEDVANAVVFLLENDFINGTVLVVDGGRSIV